MIVYRPELQLMSARSMRVSLEAIRNGEAGLNAKRTSMLNRVPNPGDWARFSVESLTMHDLAYLTADTGHEFAILRGKTEDILFHGTCSRCTFDDVLVAMLFAKQLEIFGHSHPGEEEPIPSKEDRQTLQQIGQHSSHLISGYSGKEVVFTADPFEIL